MPNFITQQEAAKLFGVNSRTIRNWITEGLITGYRLPGGHAVRVDRDEILAKIKAIPTRQPFGPKANIVDLRPKAVVKSQPSDRPDDHELTDAVESGVDQ